MTLHSVWERILSDLPLIPILRGMTPAQAPLLGGLLEQAGFLCLEIPLNSPDALTSLRLLRDSLNGRVLVGAGTVVTTEQVDAVRQAGAEFVVSPNTNPAVIRATKACGMISLPGFATPSEAFSALDAGADGLKLFPAEAAPPSVLRALKSVLPADIPIFPVGGITAEGMAGYVEAGAAGFGIGSGLYRPGQPDIRERAGRFVEAWRKLRPG